MRAVAEPPRGSRMRRASGARDLSKQRLRVWVRLLRATRAVENEIRERFRREFDVTLPRFDVMAALDRAEEGLTMTALSRALMVSNGNVTGIIERLAADGLVVREIEDADRRAIRVRLTQQGRETFAAMARAHEGWIDDLLSDLTQRDAEALSPHLDRIRRASRNEEQA